MAVIAHRGRLAHDRSARDVDQVPVVGTGRLVGIARGQGAARVLLEQARVAARVVERRAARIRLAVAPGHDHDPVVVAGVEDCLLDRAVAASVRELSVDPGQLARALARDPLVLLARTKAVAALLRLAQRLAKQLQGLTASGPLADDSDLAGSLAGRRGAERSRRRYLAAGGRLDRGVGRRVGPVGGSLEMGERRR